MITRPALQDTLKEEIASSNERVLHVSSKLCGEIKVSIKISPWAIIKANFTVTDS